MGSPEDVRGSTLLDISDEIVPLKIWGSSVKGIWVPCGISEYLKIESSEKAIEKSPVS